MEINRSLLEIRFKPRARVLDYRGELTEGLANTLNLANWKVDSNRIDLQDDSRSRHAFLSFRNAGFTAVNSPTDNYFSDQAKKFLDVLSKIKVFEEDLYVERIGCRILYLLHDRTSFEELLQRFRLSFADASDDAKKIFDGEIVDIGLPLTIKHKGGTINFMIGPIESHQSKEIFKPQQEDETEDWPESAIFVDMDYWTRPESSLKVSDVSRMVVEFSRDLIVMKNRIRSLLLQKK